MKALARIAACSIFCAAAGTASAAPPPPQCASEAVVQARKLLVFHFGEDNRMEVGPEVKELAPIRNPANKKQQFKVLEVWGSIYKGNYRMRLIYYPMDKSCLLMGQEVLELANL
ncbi:hypothetical protein DBV14_00920 [Variovorax sp. KBW07]|uniref:hypothetical protein n=1 Tax=Variovorax sp. KBW07 TaxID=2153358 RepID=UPI000F57B998|nr:hypothetical protein [Variovorax sp. KBW07]RQO64321.1 hypothetical protein DBV14_00920 [Variovorax sp. KBW07]